MVRTTIACLLVGTVVFSSSTLNAATLLDALVSAYMSNPILQAKRAQLRALDEGVVQALSGWRPTIEVGSSFGIDRAETNLLSSETLTPWSGDLTIVQPLYRGGRTVAETKQAENLVAAERSRLLALEQSVLLDCSIAYINVLRDEALVELRNNNVQVLQRQREATEDRFQVGEITRTDVAQAEARLSRSVSDLVEAEGKLMSSRAAYAGVVGAVPESLESAPKLRDLPASKQDAISIAIDNNPYLAIAISEEQASRNAVDVSRGRLLPVIQLNGEITHRRDVTAAIDESDNYGLSAQVIIPLYQSGSVYSEIRRSRQINSQRRIEIETARREVTESVSKAWELLNSAQAQINARQDEVKAADIALEGVKQESIVGARTTLDVLDAEQELLDAKVALVVAERNEFVASFELAESIGGLTAKNLDLPIELYDPETNYRDVRDRRWGPDVPWE